MSKAYKLNGISGILSYSVDDICDIFKEKRLHPQTVHKWLKDGLNKIDNHKPVLIFGSVLIEFLGKLNNSRKVITKFDEFYCLECREPRKPYHKLISIEQNSSFLRGKAICPTCRTILNRSYKMCSYSELKKIFRLTDVKGLYDSLNSTVKAQEANNSLKMKNESINQGEFNYE